MRVQLVKTRRVGLALVMMSLWTVLASSQAQAGINEWTSNGPGAGVISALVIVPVTPTTLYASTSHGVFTSSDGGAHWSATDWPSFSAFAIDPVTPTTLYAGTNGARELPVRPSAGRVGHAAPWGRCVNHVSERGRRER